MTMPYDTVGNATWRAYVDACAGNAVPVKVAVRWFLLAGDLVTGIVVEQRASA
jgi:hypothetical protein